MPSNVMFTDTMMGAEVAEGGATLIDPRKALQAVLELRPLQNADSIGLSASNVVAAGLHPLVYREMPEAYVCYDRLTVVLAAAVRRLEERVRELETEAATHDVAASVAAASVAASAASAAAASAASAAAAASVATHYAAISDEPEAKRKALRGDGRRSAPCLDAYS